MARGGLSGIDDVPPLFKFYLKSLTGKTGSVKYGLSHCAWETKGHYCFSVLAALPFGRKSWGHMRLTAPIQRSSRVCYRRNT